MPNEEEKGAVEGVLGDSERQATTQELVDMITEIRDRLGGKREGMTAEGRCFRSRPRPQFLTGVEFNEQPDIVVYELDGRSVGGAIPRSGATGRRSPENPYCGAQTYHTDCNGRILPD